MADGYDDDFPPGCGCERINVDSSADVPGTRFIRGRSDPPCRVHLPAERSLYDTAYQRGAYAALNAIVADMDAEGARRAMDAAAPTLAVPRG